MRNQRSKMMDNVFCVLLSFTMCMMVSGCNNGNRGSGSGAPGASVSGTNEPDASVTTIPEPVEESPEELFLKKLAEQETLSDAISVSLFLFDDSKHFYFVKDKMSKWMLNNDIKFGDLEKLPKTSYALVMKDSESAAGKTVCGSGRVIEISKVDSNRYIGGMFHSHDVIRFLSVGSTGDIVEGSFTTYCGVVIGKESYNNSGGGTTHAVTTVGMFKLPENM